MSTWHEEAPQRRVLEVVGPPGCGKSSLTRELVAIEPRILASERLAWKNWRHLPFHLLHAPTMASALYRQRLLGRHFTAQELKDIVYAETWHRVLSRQARKSGSIIVADQGPVFKIAMLRAFGPPGILDARFEQWWARVLDRWSETLWTIVWLDAPDAVLLSRVRAREKQHLLKRANASNAAMYLARYREELQFVNARLGASERICVIRHDTRDCSVSELAADLLPIFLEH